MKLCLVQAAHLEAAFPVAYCEQPAAMDGIDGLDGVVKLDLTKHLGNRSVLYEHGFITKKPYSHKTCLHIGTRVYKNIKNKTVKN